MLSFGYLIWHIGIIIPYNFYCFPWFFKFQQRKISARLLFYLIIMLAKLNKVNLIIRFLNIFIWVNWKIEPISNTSIIYNCWIVINELGRRQSAHVVFYTVVLAPSCKKFQPTKTDTSYKCNNYHCYSPFLRS